MFRLSRLTNVLIVTLLLSVFSLSVIAASDVATNTKEFPNITDWKHKLSPQKIGTVKLLAYGDGKYAFITEDAKLRYYDTSSGEFGVVPGASNFIYKPVSIAYSKDFFYITDQNNGVFKAKATLEDANFYKINNNNRNIKLFKKVVNGNVAICDYDNGSQDANSITQGGICNFNESERNWSLNMRASDITGVVDIECGDGMCLAVTSNSIYKSIDNAMSWMNISSAAFSSDDNKASYMQIIYNIGEGGFFILYEDEDGSYIRNYMNDKLGRLVLVPKIKISMLLSAPGLIIAVPSGEQHFQSVYVSSSKLTEAIDFKMHLMPSTIKKPTKHIVYSDDGKFISMLNNGDGNIQFLSAEYKQKYINIIVDNEKPLISYIGTKEKNLQLKIIERGYADNESSCNNLTASSLSNYQKKYIKNITIPNPGKPEGGVCTYQAAITLNGSDTLIPNPIAVKVAIKDLKENVSAPLSLSVVTLGALWQKGTKITLVNYDEEWIQSISYGNGVFVAVSTVHSPLHGLVYYSTDGIQWKVANSVVGNSALDSVVYGKVSGNGMFVVIGVDAKNHVTIIKSPDGRIWEKVKSNVPSTANAADLAYGSDKSGKGVFLLLLSISSGDTSKIVLTASSDLVTWGSPLALKSTCSSNAITSSDNGFIIGCGSIASKKPQTNTYYIASIEGNNITLSGPNKIMFPSEHQGYEINITSGGGALVFSAVSSTVYKHSSGGWQESNMVSGEHGSSSSMIYTEGLFVGPNESTSDPSVLVSTDLGVSFTTVTNVHGTNNDDWLTAYGNGRIIAVSTKGDVMISGDTAPVAGPAKAAN